MKEFETIWYFRKHIIVAKGNPRTVGINPTANDIEIPQKMYTIIWLYLRNLRQSGI